MQTMQTDLYQRAQTWLSEDPDSNTRQELQQLLDARDDDALQDRFSGMLEFGTAGLRGLLGAGPNRMNRAVVIRTTAGLAAYLLQTVPDAARRGVVVGYDGRKLSRELAEDTARVLAGKNIQVYLFADLGPTPRTAFAVLRCHAAAGIMITASHNPPAYNGYKVYWEHGAQIVSPIDAGIAAEIASLGALSEIAMPSRASVGDQIRVLPETLEEEYLADVYALAQHPGPLAPLRVVYTALHGVGNKLATTVLSRFGEVISVPEQAEPDGDFPTVTFPNPEEKGAMDLALALAARENADLVIANDPDADRLAVAVKGTTGWKLLSGNDIGALLGHYLMQQYRQKHPISAHSRQEHLKTTETFGQKPLVATTIVSSPLLGRIASDLQIAYVETLTGFKWIMHRAAEASAQEGADFLFGYEEALGYCCGKVVRDKDGISAAFVMAELAAFLKQQGKTLIDRLQEIAAHHGLYVSGQHTLTLPGAEGQRAIAALMSNFRQKPPKELDGRQVTRVADYERGEIIESGVATPTGLPTSNVMGFGLADGARVMIRPSGTEPKLKIYFDQRQTITHDLAEAQAEAHRKLTRLMEAVIALTQ